jgi:hypothetical protein
MKHCFSLFLTLLLCVACVLTMSACDEASLGGTQAESKGAETIPSADTAARNSTDDAEESTTSSPAAKKNALKVECDLDGNTVVATVKIEGDVSFAGLVGDLIYDADILTPVSSSTVLGGMVVNTQTPGAVSFSYASVSNVTTEQSLFSVTFSYTQTPPVTFDFNLSVDPDNFSNANLENVEFELFGSSITID